MDTSSDTITIKATIEHIVYASPDTGYAVLRCTLPSSESVTLTGTFHGVRPGQALAATGRWTQHPRFGQQFAVDGWVEDIPSSREAMRKYLASGLVAGIGPVLAERLVEAFGDDTFDVIENHPERLGEVYGVGKKKAASILARWQDQKAVRTIMVFLKEHDVSDALAAKIYNHYREDALRVLRETPYRLAYDLRGVGFLTADRLARNLGVEAAATPRLRCGLQYVLDEASLDGDLYLERETLLGRASDTLAVDGTAIPAANLETALNSLVAEGRLVADGDAVYLCRLAEAERESARRLARLAARRDDIEITDGDTLLPHDGTEYTPLQRQAIATAATGGATIITGGPGTGKTTTLKGLLAVLEARGETTLLASPTGKAAKRLEEATGRKASTIHRLLEWNPKESAFQRDEDMPLEGDALVIDEVSMVDMPLLHALLRALGENMRLVLVGDADQLSSIGPGNCLKEMMASRAIPCIRLDTIFRQALGSDIIRGAHAINGGHVPDTAARKDLWFARRDDDQAIATTIVSYLQSRLDKGDDLSSVQVLSPMKRGAAGTEELNRRIQALANPTGRPVTKGLRELRIGDRVINLHNDYDKDVFNGDQGVITEYDEDEAEFTVSFDGRPVRYKTADADSLIHAWALTVHRSQGSEFDTAIIVVSSRHAVMLQRQLLYTAVTRAKKLCLIIGDERAMHIAVNNNRVRIRRTQLARRILDCVKDATKT